MKKILNKTLPIILSAAVLFSTVSVGALAVTPSESLMKTASTATPEGTETLKADGEDRAAETGTQTDAREDQTNVDADIEEEVEATIPEEWVDVHIKSVEDFLVFAKNCRLDTWSRNKRVYLDADISLLGCEFDGIATFGGYFDGQDHTIKDLNIYESESYLGLFSRVQSDGVIIDLNVEGRVTPSGATTIIGGLCGDNSGIIANCSFKGVVDGEDYVGGLVGINELSGMIMDCETSGSVTGTHFTGGIAGENMGNIGECTNRACVNITNHETALSVDDISVDSLLSVVGLEDEDKDEAEASAMVNGVVDMGGIAGISIGVIQYCTNEGPVGYENVGYNVGGIAGRQSGYILSSTNNAEILGRKDVGGIVGQAEPYVTLDFANDITQQLSENIEKLHDVISVTLNDADSQSDTISARLSVIQAFADNALNDTKFLESETIDWANGMTSAANEAIDRVNYIITESGKSGGVIDNATSAAKSTKDAANSLKSAVNDLDVYKYMSKDEQLEYDAARNNLEEAIDEHTDYVSDYTEDNYDAFYNYYIDYYRFESGYTTGDGDSNENNLAYVDGDNEVIKETSSSSQPSSMTAAQITADDSTYKKTGTWVHKGADDDEFPSTDGGDQQTLDNSLRSKAAEEATTACGDAALEYADKKYQEAHGGATSSKYANDIADYADTMASIIYAHTDEIEESTLNDAEKAFGSISDAAGSLQSAGSSGKAIVDNIKSRDSISLPSFSSEYKTHATSLTNNIQGMSDNFGLLNNEMNGASDALISDLSSVNDQFNVIMQLFTDAIDGVLDNDYSDTYEDASMDVAESTTDATIDSCTNNGEVKGSINVSGIAGTMAIEYDFDLESDVTGIKDATMNRTYLTKCVLRKNVNKEDVTAQKNYAGGACGLQEMGTIIDCENYAKIESSTAGYVGGIAGASYSNIVRGYSKCSLTGLSYVGGIVGDGCNIYDSLAMVKISDATEWYGAVAGHVDTDGIVRNNFFVGDDLAGIDRVSYAKKAEPITFIEAQSIEDVPEYFDNVYVSFVVSDEDEDGNEVETELQEYACAYGQNIAEADYPEVPEKEGYYVVWDTESIDRLEYDEVITATYVRNNTTLAGDILRSNKQSAILVDGEFKEGDELRAVLNVNVPDTMENCEEYWSLEIPQDGNEVHQVRYIKSDDMRNEPEIYVNETGTWRKLTDEEIGSMGSYETFNVTGNMVKLQMIYSDKKHKILMTALIIAGIIAGLAILACIIIVIVKSRKRVHRKVKRMAEDIKEKQSAKEPAMKFVSEEDVPAEETPSEDAPAEEAVTEDVPSSEPGVPSEDENKEDEQ